MQMAADSKPLPGEIRARMERYRAELLAFGMREPGKRESSVWHWYFFKPVMELTAFIINLKGNDDCIEVVYGYASTAFTRFAGDENALNDLGVPDGNITIREKLTIRDKGGEEAAGRQIADMYRRYLQSRKDDLLAFATAKRKAFIQQLALKLKPLGFKKRENTWTRTLENGHYLMFNAQKSAFSDEYYFNIYVGRDDVKDRGDCYSARLGYEGIFLLDWQTLSKEALASFLNGEVIPALEEIIHTPLDVLGKKPSYWSGCRCDRKKCARCWMEKNFREAKED